MVVLDIYKQNIQTVYKTTLISKATIFVLLSIAFTISFPFLISYKSKGFWLKYDVFYEQPTVRFRGEYLFVGLSSNLSNVFVCNDFNYFEKMEHLDGCNKIKVREIDNNLDNKMDSLDFELELDLPQKEFLTQFTIVLSLDYKLMTTCPLEMQSAIIFQQSFNQRTSFLSVVANLDLVQKNPLMCYARRKDRVHNFPIIFNKEEMRSFQVDNIIDDYLKRNISTHLKEIYSSIKLSNEDVFTLNLKVLFPEHKVRYKASFWQILKWAWIQYLAVFVVVAWVVRIIVNYVFENHLVLFYKVSPIKKEL